MASAKFDCVAINVYRIFNILFRVNITPEGMKAVVTLANGDMRKSLNILQVLQLTLSIDALFEHFK